MALELTEEGIEQLDKIRKKYGFSTIDDTIKFLAYIEEHQPEKIERSLDEFIVLPGKTTKDCTADKVDVSQDFYGIHFRYSLMGASMSCLYNEFKSDLALAMSREGIPPVIHYNDKGQIEKQVAIIESVKKAAINKGDVEYIDSPVIARTDQSLEDAIGLSDKYGHSVIPVVDNLDSKVLKKIFIRPFGEIEHDLTMHLENVGAPLCYVKDRLVLGNTSMSDEEVKKTLRELVKKDTNGVGGLKQAFLPILDKTGKLVKMAFLQKFQAYFCGASISTHKGWYDRAQACIKAGADFLSIDTQDIYSDFGLDVGKEYKKNFRKFDIELAKENVERVKKIRKKVNIPLVIGNMVTGEAFYFLAEYADFVKVGQMTGAGCKTGAVKNIGRPLHSALDEVKGARYNYAKKTGKYRPIIGDGGINTAPRITVAAKNAELMMGGRLFAQCFESAGLGFVDDEGKKQATKEDDINYKEYWGEGSSRATMSPERYLQGYLKLKTLVEEGDYGLFQHMGRVKPVIEELFNAVRSTMSGAGCKNFSEYRKKARLGLLSSKAMEERHPSKELIILEQK